MEGYWAQFAKIAVAHLLAVASPGPDFAMVVRQSLAHGRRAATWTAVGIGSAILVHVAYALLGIGLVLRTNPVAFTVLKFLAAGYLAWMGIRALLARPCPTLGAEPGLGEGDIARPGVPSPRAAWTTGVLTNVFNPKVTLFIVAVFTLVDPATPKLAQVSYGLYISAMTMAWFSVVAVFFTREPVRRAFLRAGVWIDRAMGIAFLAFAAFLAGATLR